MNKQVSKGREGHCFPVDQRRVSSMKIALCKQLGILRSHGKAVASLKVYAYRATNVILFLTLAIPLILSQEVSIGSVQTVKLGTRRWYPDYQIVADPTNPKNLLICGGKWDAGKNTLSGFVYTSSDGGQLWHESLEDKSTDFVSEHSCAFGVDGKAYFISGASKVVDGVPHHELGITRIFTSDDSGQTWAQATQTEFSDSPVSVVNIRVGPFRNQLFTFYNESDPRKSNPLTRVATWSFRPDEAHVAGVGFDPEIEPFKYRGSFPHQAIVLNDDSIVALYRATLDTSGPTELAIGVVHFFPAQNRAEESVPAVQVVLNKEHSCFIDEADSYDSARDKIWIGFHKFTEGRCKFLLIASNDHGRTWSNPHEVAAPSTQSGSYHNPAMTFNSKGELGFLWRDTISSDCWYFAASKDEGNSFTRARPLSSSCSSSSTARETANAFLMVRVSQSSPSDASPGPTLSVINHLNGVWQFASPLVATRDGSFHPVWIEVSSGQGELRTATVSVARQPSTLRKTAWPDTTGTRDIGSEVALLYGADLHYDSQGGTLLVKVVLRNKTDKPIPGPIYLEAMSIKSDIGLVEVSNATNGRVGTGAVWVLQDALPQGVLEPLSTTRPFLFSFNISRSTTVYRPKPHELVTMQLRALATRR